MLSLCSSLELQIHELVTKIADGQGLPWPKPAYLRRLAYQERSRVLVLRQLEERLGTRETGDTVMAKSEQIIAVVSLSLSLWLNFFGHSKEGGLWSAILYIYH